MKRTAEEVLTELLVMRTQDGDASAWRTLVGIWEKRLYRHARRLTGHHEAARDVTQEAWLAMLRGISRLDDPARFRPWAYRIVTNKAADWTRRQQRRRKLLASVQEEAARDAQDKPAANGGPLTDLREAIQQLPSDRRALISMLYVDGMSLEEIADVLRIPVGTVKSRLFSVRQELKAIIEGKP